MALILFISGLVFLVVGAELLVRGASRLAAVLGISPIVIGLTVVAFGTSAPELAVSIKSAWADQAGIAVGNVVGSNIFNVLFILGVTALIVPLTVSQRLVRLDVPIMVALSIVVLLFALDGRISQIDGGLLVIALVVYVGYAIYQSRRESAEVRDEYAAEFPDQSAVSPSWLSNVALVIGGLVLLVLGAGWLVDGAITFARHLGISELVIGLTVVAAGTSLPEVVTSIMAALRGERDIAVGNVVGSNLFNIMGVLGISGLIAPHGIEISAAALHFDIPVMIAVAFACLPILFTGGVVSRWEAVLLLGYYVAYTLYLVLAASQHDSLAPFSNVMLYFVIPLTAITLVTIAVREMRSNGRRGPAG
ncbi:calcium/sodium antiporter [Marinobacter similis]|uniref:Sodium:calcium antiporter n=1 Tax=Marinobacter similis TaxID=1420916 RepID=W5YK61_9GAMM|nr:calcium/sodium antiporter [Marinobacter similis]AHI29471.1 sodium:calcium antiporter [Marinobacter similis]